MCKKWKDMQRKAILAALLGHDVAPVLESCLIFGKMAQPENPRAVSTYIIIYQNHSHYTKYITLYHPVYRNICK